MAQPFNARFGVWQREDNAMTTIQMCIDAEGDTLAVTAAGRVGRNHPPRRYLVSTMRSMGNPHTPRLRARAISSSVWYSKGASGSATAQPFCSR